MLSLLDVLQKTTDFLAGKGVENARLNAELLIGHALGLKRMQLYLQFERLLAEADLEKVRPLVRRRGQREPLAYVLGDTEFCGLRLKTDRRALVPRPETEQLFDLVVRTCVDEPPPTRILDLGTGSGCLALALAQHWPEAQVTAVDLSEDALSLARENAAATRLEGRVTFVRSSWYQALPPGAPFDLIVSNPPYLTEEETLQAEPEVREHEPRQALIAARHGMADLEAIIAGAPAHLVPRGWLALETGIAQHDALLCRLAEAGFAERLSRRDLAGRDRFVLGRRSSVQPR